MFRFAPPVLRPRTQLHTPADHVGTGFVGTKDKVVSQDWPLPQEAGDHPQDLLRQTPACPGAVVVVCTADWITSCCCCPVLLQVIDSMFVFPLPEKADYKPCAIYWIHIVRIELVLFTIFFFIILKATNVKSFCLLLWEKKKALKLLGFFKKTQEMSFRSKITFYKIKTMS